MTTNTTDPFPVSAHLRSAVASTLAATGETQTELAVRAGLTPSALSRALGEDFDARPGTVRAVLVACGYRLELVRVEAPPPLPAATTTEAG